MINHLIPPGPDVEYAPGRPVPCRDLLALAPPAACARGHDLSIPGSCARCDDYHPGITPDERTRCEVWSRVMGYHRPVAAYNTGKRQEHADRQFFVEAAAYPFVVGAGGDDD